MNSSGVVLVLVGIWVCSQILGGEALARLGVGNDISAQAGTGGSTSATPGMTVVDHSAKATVGGGTWA